MFLDNPSDILWLLKANISSIGVRNYLGSITSSDNFQDSCSRILVVHLNADINLSSVCFASSFLIEFLAPIIQIVPACKPSHCLLNTLQEQKHRSVKIRSILEVKCLIRRSYLAGNMRVSHIGIIEDDPAHIKPHC